MERPKTAAVSMLVALAVLWVLEVLDQLAFNQLDRLAIRPRQLDSLPNIFTAPLLHFGFTHLIANSLPFLVLGFLVLVSGRRQFWGATLIIVVTSGAVVWLFSPPGTITAGASGLIFGWLTYLLLRGVFNRNLTQIVEAVLIFLIYGSILGGVLPCQAGVSGQGDFGGALGGIVAAVKLARPKR